MPRFCGVERAIAAAAFSQQHRDRSRVTWAIRCPPATAGGVTARRSTAKRHDPLCLRVRELYSANGAPQTSQARSVGAIHYTTLGKTQGCIGAVTHS